MSCPTAIGRRRVAALCLILLAGLGSGSGASGQPAPDTVIYNGRVVTVDEAFSYAQAVAITDGVFTAVGSDQAVRALARPTTVEIDVAGRTVLPGLMDNHLHDAGGGPGVDLSGARSLDDVLDAIAARVREREPGALVRTNRDWHEAQLAEQRLPLRRDLDSVAPDNPVVVVRGGHEYVLNSAALARWGIDESTPEPAGGQISRYPDGTLNGELIDRARNLVELPAPQEQGLDARIEARIAQYDRLHAAGLTSIRHPSGDLQEWELLKEMQRRGVLSMRITHLLRPRGATGAQDVRRRLEAWGVAPGEGDEWLKNGGIKIGVDGGFEGGWMREPYAEPWGASGTYFGINTVPREHYVPVVRELNRLGWRVATHAVGDAAIDLVLDAYEAADSERSIVGRRWSIEHGFLPVPDQFPRMRDLGVLISAQNHLYVAGPSLEKYWGRARAARTTPVRTYIDEGIEISGGTDSSVVPYPPLWVIYHFVTRDTISGGVFGPDQAIAREEAVRLLTINNAYLTFEEDIKGSIEPGKLADLVVISDDIMSCPVECIRNAEVTLTMVGGRIVYER